MNDLSRTTKQGQEGFVVAAREGTFNSIDLLSEVDNNIMTVQIVYPNMTVRVIVVHGPQEGDLIEDKKRFYKSLPVEIERCKSCGHSPIILGDLNAKIQKSDEEIIACSSNGKLLKYLTEDYQLNVVNFHHKTVGKWTRIQKSKNGTKKSVFDYVLLDDQLISQISSMIIDEEHMSTPYRIIRRQGKNKECLLTTLQ